MISPISTYNTYSGIRPKQHNTVGFKGGANIVNIKGGATTARVFTNNIDFNTYEEGEKRILVVKSPMPKLKRYYVYFL